MALEMMSNPLIGNQEFMQKQQEIMMEQIKEMQQIASMQVIEQFPDVLQNYSDEETKMLFETMISRNQIDLLANKKGPLGGFTALHWMCIKNDLEMIEFLIKRCKADVNSRAQLGETPILICIKNCNIHSIELLVKNGADLNVRDAYNRSILHWCAFTGRVALFYYFYKYHMLTNVNDLDQFNQNPLHIACASGFSDLINFLMKTGDMDYYVQDLNGNTCLHMAAKSGLARTCWLLTRENNGECAKLVGYQNKNNQTAFDLIRNEKGLQYKKIRDWLRLEAKTNHLLHRDNYNLLEKKSDDIYNSKSSNSSLLKIQKGTRFFNWNSTRSLQAELAERILSFPLVLTIPIVLNHFLFEKHSLNMLRGFLGYSSFLGILYFAFRQRHRITHISGRQNPYHIGFLSIMFLHNYYTFYFNVLESFNVARLFDMTCVFLTVWNIYSYCKVLVADPGFAKESITKPDGSPFELKDLIKMNTKDMKNTKDSIRWVIEPTYLEKEERRTKSLQAYFCESCVSVQRIPSKHCKLCEHCCVKFDHHCLFISKCVGGKNHRMFVYFLISTLVCCSIFVYHIYLSIVQAKENLATRNENLSPNEKIGLFYFLFASELHVKLVTLFIINGFGIIMISLLLYMQMRVIMLGYTNQFLPPSYFTKANKKMQTKLGALMHRLDNLYIFFCKSFQDNEQLYYDQQKAYFNQIANDNNIIPIGLYPRDNFAANNNSTLGFSNDPVHQRNNETIKNNNHGNHGKQFEIELD